MNFPPPLHFQFPSNVLLSHLSPFLVILLPVHLNLFSPQDFPILFKAIISILLNMLITLKNLFQMLQNILRDGLSQSHDDFVPKFYNSCSHLTMSISMVLELGLPH